MKKTCFLWMFCCILLFGTGNAFAETAITAVTPLEAVGIFEAGEEVGFTLTHNQSETVRALTFRISDLSGTVRYQDSFKLQANTNTTAVSMGIHPVGWYRVRFYENESEVKSVYCAFSVLRPGVPKKSAPLAADYAGTYAGSDGLSHYAISRAEKQGYAAAMKKAGLGTVRERVVGTAGESAIYKAIEEQIDDISAEGTGVLLSAAEGRKTDEDLYLTYCRAMSNADYYKNRITAWEGSNEPDIHGIMPDREAASLKAMAIGILDSGANAVKATSGLCWVNSDFTEVLMQNGVMDYLDVLNVHSHCPVGGGWNAYYGIPKWILQNARELATVYGERQVWCGEAGLYTLAGENYEPRDDQLKLTARYAITSMTEAFAKTGVNKNFFFLFRHYVENHGGTISDMGMFSKNHLPYPAYSSLATLGYYLGDGTLVGQLRELPETAEGYLFDNGEKQLAILWNESAENRNMQFRTKKPVRVIDLVGKSEERRVLPHNGMVGVQFDNHPVLVLFEDEPEKACYSMTYPKIPEISVTSIPESKKIVLRQDWGETAGGDDAYQLEPGQVYTVSLEVMNLSAKKASGTITMDASGALEIVGAGSQRFSAKAYENTMLTFRVRVREDYYRDDDAYVSFGGSTSAGALSESVAKCRVSAKRNYLDRELYSIGFRGWHWVQQGELSESDGIYFVMNQSGAVSGKVFVDIGTQYLQYQTYQSSETGAVVYRIPWEIFYDSVNGMNNGIELDRVRQMQIVADSGKENVSGLITVGVYSYETPKEEIFPKIRISGAENLGIYQNNRTLKLSAEIPEGLSDVRVYVNYSRYDNFTMDENGHVEIDLAHPAEGAYKVMVSARARFGRQVYGEVDFYVRDKWDYAAKGAFYEPVDYRYING